MEILRGLLALLCVVLAGAQTQIQRNRLAGKFTEMCCTFQLNVVISGVYGAMLHKKFSFCVII